VSGVTVAPADSFGAMDAVAQLREEIEANGKALGLDVASDVIAQYLDDEVASGATMRRIDALAVQSAATAPAELVHELVETFGFGGNRENYYDPGNSLLPHVIDRRVGIPITLAVVAIEVGRRNGLTLSGVGMPGHFLLGLDDQRMAYADPFSGSQSLTVADCRQIFNSVVGDRLAWDDDFLVPVHNLEIVARMLNNLKGIHLQRSDVDALRRVLELRACLPGMPPSDRNALAVALAARGRYAEAATELEDLADRSDTEDRVALLGRAQQLRARLN